MELELEVGVGFEVGRKYCSVLFMRPLWFIRRGRRLGVYFFCVVGGCWMAIILISFFFRGGLGDGFGDVELALFVYSFFKRIDGERVVEYGFVSDVDGCCETRLLVDQTRKVESELIDKAWSWF